MKLRFTETDFIIVLSFLLGKVSGLLVLGHVSGVLNNWSSLLFSLVFLTVAFVLINLYTDRKKKSIENAFKDGTFKG